MRPTLAAASHETDFAHFHNVGHTTKHASNQKSVPEQKREISSYSTGNSLSRFCVTVS
jgi:hypothetical protein